MLTRPRESRKTLTPGGLPWVLLALAALLAAPARGATVSAGTETHREAAGGHHCKCRMCRGEGSCCCSKGKTRARGEARPAAASEPGPVRPTGNDRSSGPCVDSAPCGGGDGLPTSAPGSSVWKAMALTAPDAPGLDRRSHPSACPDSTLHAAILASRLDDPPEALTLA